MGHSQRFGRRTAVAIIVMLSVILTACSSSTNGESSSGATQCDSLGGCISAGRQAGATGHILTPRSGLATFQQGWFTPSSDGVGWGYRLEYHSVGSSGPFEELAIRSDSPYPCAPLATVRGPVVTPSGHHVCYQVGGGNDTAAFTADGVLYEIDVALPSPLNPAQRQQFLIGVVDSLD